MRQEIENEEVEAIRVNERFWRINGRLIPAVFGGAETAEEKAKREEEEAADQQANEKVNAVVASHLKRAMKTQNETIAKLVAEGMAKAMETLKAAQPAPTEGAGEKPEDGKSKKVDPAFKLMQEEVERLKKTSADDRAARLAIEDKARKDGARTKLKDALDAKGVKGPRGAALIAFLEGNGALRFTDSGEPILAISRPRQKGGPAEELEFDIAAGVDDWAKTAEAAEFLPAPSDKTPQGRPRPTPRPQGNDGVVRKGTRYEAPAVTDDEAARRTHEQLTNQGINVDALLNE